MKTLRINLYGVINTLSLKEKFFYSKNWIEDGIVMLKNIRLDNGILDVGFFGKYNTRQKTVLQGNQYPSKSIKSSKN